MRAWIRASVVVLIVLALGFLGRRWLGPVLEARRARRRHKKVTKLLHEARQHHQRRECRRALKVANHAERVGWDRADVYLLRGRLLYELGRLTEAEVDAARAHALKPGDKAISALRRDIQHALSAAAIERRGRQ